jgi:hypothetical protein
VGRVNEGDEGEEIWLMNFIYIHGTEPSALLQLLEVEKGSGYSEVIVRTI